MKELTAKEVQNKLEANETIHLVDVREDEEVIQGMIPGTIHIRLNELPEQLHQLDQNKEYIVICHSGGRSRMAQELLLANGFQAINMSGGMLAWEGEVE